MNTRFGKGVNAISYPLFLLVNLGGRRRRRTTEAPRISDDSDLLDLDAEGYAIERTAEFLGREPGEVIDRLETLKPKA